MALPVLAAPVLASRATKIAKALGTSVSGLRSRLSDTAVWGTLAAGAAVVGFSDEEAFQVFDFLSEDESSNNRHPRGADGFKAESSDVASEYVKLRASLLDDFAVINQAIIAAGGVDRFHALRRALVIPEATINAWALENKRG